MLLNVFTILTLSIQCCFSAKILAMIGAEVRSHLQSFGPILEHLAPYHNITLYLPENFNYIHENITMVKADSSLSSENLNNLNILQRPCEIDSFKIYMEQVLHTDVQRYENAFKHKNIQRLIQSEEKFDLLLVNAYLIEHYLAFAHKFNIPIVQFSPSHSHIWFSDAVGGEISWEKDLSFSIKESSKTLLGRIQKYIKNWQLKQWYYKTMLPTIDKVVSKYIPSIPKLEEIIKTKTELIILNTHSAMGIPKPTSSSILQFGGVHISTPKPLPPNLEEYISSAEHGVIYFSLGTFVQSNSLKKDTIVKILNIFGRLKQKILWKWNGNLENVPDNVKILNWYPQQDILRHKNVKLFITQGGMMSLIESCTFGKPVLIMPCLFDQYTNAYVAEKVGYGLSLNFCQFSEEAFYEKIMELLSNPKYKETSKQVSKVMQNDLKNIPENINFWIKFVIDNHKTSFLKNLTSTATWIETTSAEIFITITVFILLIFALSYYLFTKMKLFIEFCKHINLRYWLKIKTN